MNSHFKAFNKVTEHVLETIDGPVNDTYAWLLVEYYNTTVPLWLFLLNLIHQDILGDITWKCLTMRRVCITLARKDNQVYMKVNLGWL